MTMERSENDPRPNHGPRPAAQLSGMELPKGWKVESPSFAPENSTGGTFSVPYMVKSEKGGKAFLKAMDYASSFASESVMERLYKSIQNYFHERDLLQRCTGMNRVVRLLDCGETHVNTNDQYSAVFYLIFELADSDIRAHVHRQEKDNIGHLLQLMHQVTVASQQLHNAQIAHLDIKPSNVLVFGQMGAKLADLGRSIENGQNSPFGSLDCVGDKRYAPPELLYANVRPEWKSNRVGCDFYLLGNLLFFLVTNSSLTQLLSIRLESLNASFHHQNRSISYDEVFPYVNRIFLQIIRELRNDPRTAFVPEIADIVKQLCDPDPAQRGLPMNRGISRYSLQRYVSKFDLLHKRNKYFHLLRERTKQELST